MYLGFPLSQAKPRHVRSYSHRHFFRLPSWYSTLRIQYSTFHLLQEAVITGSAVIPIARGVGGAYLPFSGMYTATAIHEGAYIPKGGTYAPLVAG